MNACFGDTFYFLALLNEDDAAHKRVIAFLRGFDTRIVTTDWVLTEVGDAMASVKARGQFCEFLRRLRANKNVQIVRASDLLFDDGVSLFEKRSDKEWSLTDCISFVVMRRLRLVDALTGDRHFEQSGFTALLK